MSDRGSGDDDHLAAIRAMREHVRSTIAEDEYRHVTSVCSDALNHLFAQRGRKGTKDELRRLVLGLEQVIRGGGFFTPCLFTCAVLDRYERLVASEEVPA